MGERKKSRAGETRKILLQSVCLTVWDSDVSMDGCTLIVEGCTERGGRYELHIRIDSWQTTNWARRLRGAAALIVRRVREHADGLDSNVAAIPPRTNP